MSETITAAPADKTATVSGRGRGPRIKARRSGGTSWRLSLIALLLVVAYAVLTPLVAPAIGGAQLLEADLSQARLPPSLEHVFGTDHAGRDLFVRVAQGVRISLLIAALCAVLSTVIGMLVGMTAAAFGGKVDAVLMRVSDAVNALPHLLLGIVIVALWRGSVIAIVASITATHWSSVARLVRAEALTAREMEYVDSAYLMGARRRDVLRRHLFPASVSQGLIGLVLLLPHAIWHESSLSFLGLGLPPDAPSLGTLLAAARGEILTGSWWTLVFPVIPLLIVTVAVAGLGAAAQRRFAPVVDSAEVMG